MSGVYQEVRKTTFGPAPNHQEEISCFCVHSFSDYELKEIPHKFQNVQTDSHISARSLRPEVFDTFISKLATPGYKCIASPSPPSSRPNTAVKDLQPVFDALRAAVLQEADAGDVIMVVGHSWSGLIVSGGLEGLRAEERRNDGKEGGVIKLALLSAIVPPENVSLIQAFGGEPPDRYDVKVYRILTLFKNIYYWKCQEPWVTCKSPIPSFYHDPSPDEAESWASKLRPHSYATKFASTSISLWRTVPSSYLICEDDRAIPLFVQEIMVTTCRGP